MKIIDISFGDTIMTNTHKTRIHSLLALAIGLLAAILAQQISTAQTTPPQGVGGTVNSPDSVLHGRTIRVADEILRQLPGITQYNQVTNLTQLSSVASLYFFGRVSENWSPRAGDFDGLVNLQSLSMISLGFGLTSLPSGIFNKLINLQMLDIRANQDLRVSSVSLEPLINLRRLYSDVSVSLPTLAVSPRSVLHGRT